MKISSRISNYINENNYKIIFLSNKINIVNYSSIEEFSNNRVVVKYSEGLTIINGHNIVVSRMLDKEILLMGYFNNIEFKGDNHEG